MRAAGQDDRREGRTTLKLDAQRSDVVNYSACVVVFISAFLCPNIRNASSPNLTNEGTELPTMSTVVVSQVALRFFGGPSGGAGDLQLTSSCGLLKRNVADEGGGGAHATPFTDEPIVAT